MKNILSIIQVVLLLVIIICGIYLYNKTSIINKQIISNIDSIKYSFNRYETILYTIDSNVNSIDKQRNINISNFNIKIDSLKKILKDEEIRNIPDIIINK